MQSFKPNRAKAEANAASLTSEKWAGVLGLSYSDIVEARLEDRKKKFFEDFYGAEAEGLVLRSALFFQMMKLLGPSAPCPEGMAALRTAEKSEEEERILSGGEPLWLVVDSVMHSATYNVGRSHSSTPSKKSAKLATADKSKEDVEAWQEFWIHYRQMTNSLKATLKPVPDDDEPFPVPLLPGPGKGGLLKAGSPAARICQKGVIFEEQRRALRYRRYMRKVSVQESDSYLDLGSSEEDYDIDEEDDEEDNIHVTEEVPEEEEEVAEEVQAEEEKLNKEKPEAVEVTPSKEEAERKLARKARRASLETAAISPSARRNGTGQLGSTMESAVIKLELALYSSRHIRRSEKTRR